MDDKLFKELDTNLKEAVKVVKGEKIATAYVVLTPADIKAVRRKAQMSQAEFARAFNLSIDTIKGWEQGKRKPDTAATNYLRIIHADPDYVLRTIAA